ncbi:MAG: azurin [Pseudomonadota bacterium]
MTRLIVAMVMAFAAQAASAQCSLDIEVGDTLKFSESELSVSSDCESVTLNLTHTGGMPKNTMGHNWVLAATGDVNALANAGLAAGLDANYVPAGDARVLAATDIIGGGESASVTFSLENMTPGGDYTFFCSFPGHWAVMKGAFKIV